VLLSCLYLGIGRETEERQKKERDGGLRGGELSGITRREKTAPEKTTWQTEAKKIWKKHPSWGKLAVAKLIAEKNGGKPGTIRKSIKKPLP